MKKNIDDNYFKKLYFVFYFSFFAFFPTTHLGHCRVAI